MTNFTPIDQVEWVSTRIIKDDLAAADADTPWYYRFDLPRPLADWDVFSYWERPRIDSMRRHLHPGMVLFDVGTEQGWMNLIYASMVGPENMVLIEPTPEFWPNIRATWERNYNLAPQATYDGLLSNRRTDERVELPLWPTISTGKLIDRNKYQYIHDNDGIPEMPLDDLAHMIKPPDAITIDVEGAELLVLQGAEHTLKEHRPLVWVSIHPTLMRRDYQTTPGQVHDFMADCGYRGEYLATDHEEHWLFR